MKKFVARLVLFALIVIVTVGGFCVAEIAAEIWVYRHHELVAPEGATVFVCGDSRTEWSLDPSVWTNLFNFSVSGRWLDKVYFTTIDIVLANPGQFKTVLVDISPEMSRLNYDLSVGEMGTKYLLLHLIHWKESIRSLNGWLGLFRDIVTKWRLRHLWKVIRGKKRFRSSLASGYNPMTHCLKLSDPDAFSRRNRRWCDQSRKLLDNPVASTVRYFALMDCIVKLAQHNALECVFITPPYHPDLLEMAGEGRVRGFVDVVRRYARQRQCRYIDMSGLCFPDEYWADGNHLNRKRARRLTDELHRRLDFEDRHGGGVSASR